MRVVHFTDDLGPEIIEMEEVSRKVGCPSLKDDKSNVRVRVEG